MTGSRRNGAASSNKGEKPNTSQGQRFIEAAREAGCSEDEAVFDAALQKIVKAEPKPSPEGSPKPVKADER